MSSTPTTTPAAAATVTEGTTSVRYHPASANHALLFSRVGFLSQSDDDSYVTPVFSAHMQPYYEALSVWCSRDHTLRIESPATALQDRKVLREKQRETELKEKSRRRWTRMWQVLALTATTGLIVLAWHRGVDVRKWPQHAGTLITRARTTLTQMMIQTNTLI